MEKSKDSLQKIQVYYDGLCRVCSFEINHYKRQLGADKIDFIDITKSDFSATKEGLDPYLAHKYLHAKTTSGKIVTGVETFKLIWQTLPKYRWAYKISKYKFINLALNFSYHIFVNIRPYLPRYKAQCKDSPYCEVN